GRLRELLAPLRPPRPRHASIRRQGHAENAPRRGAALDPAADVRRHRSAPQGHADRPRIGPGELMKPSLLQMAADSNAKLRSKAVAVLGELGEVPSDVVLERVLNDTDARVRANAIEVLENKAKAGYVPLLAERARAN